MAQNRRGSNVVRRRGSRVSQKFEFVEFLGNNRSAAELYAELRQGLPRLNPPSQKIPRESVKGTAKADDNPYARFWAEEFSRKRENAKSEGLDKSSQAEYNHFFYTKFKRASNVSRRDSHMSMVSTSLDDGMAAGPARRGSQRPSVLLPDIGPASRRVSNISSVHSRRPSNLHNQEADLPSFPSEILDDSDPLSADPLYQENSQEVAKKSSKKRQSVVCTVGLPMRQGRPRKSESLPVPKVAAEHLQEWQRKMLAKARKSKHDNPEYFAKLQRQGYKSAHTRRQGSIVMDRNFLRKMSHTSHTTDGSHEDYRGRGHREPWMRMRGSDGEADPWQDNSIEGRPAWKVVGGVVPLEVITNSSEEWAGPTYLPERDSEGRLIAGAWGKNDRKTSVDLGNGNMYFEPYDPKAGRTRTPERSGPDRKLRGREASLVGYLGESTPASTSTPTSTSFLGSKKKKRAKRMAVRPPRDSRRSSVVSIQRSLRSSEDEDSDVEEGTLPQISNRKSSRDDYVPGPPPPDPNDPNACFMTWNSELSIWEPASSSTSKDPNAPRLSWNPETNSWEGNLPKKSTKIRKTIVYGPIPPAPDTSDPNFLSLTWNDGIPDWEPTSRTSVTDPNAPRCTWNVETQAWEGTFPERKRRNPTQVPVPPVPNPDNPDSLSLTWNAELNRWEQTANYSSQDPNVPRLTWNPTTGTWEGTWPKAGSFPDRKGSLFGSDTDEMRSEEGGQSRRSSRYDDQSEEEEDECDVGDEDYESQDWALTRMIGRFEDEKAASRTNYLENRLAALKKKGPQRRTMDGPIESQGMDDEDDLKEVGYHSLMIGRLEPMVTYLPNMNVRRLNLNIPPGKSWSPFNLPSLPECDPCEEMDNPVLESLPRKVEIKSGFDGGVHVPRERIDGTSRANSPPNSRPNSGKLSSTFSNFGRGHSGRLSGRLSQSAKHFRPSAWLPTNESRASKEMQKVSERLPMPISGLPSSPRIENSGWL